MVDKVPQEDDTEDEGKNLLNPFNDKQYRSLKRAYKKAVEDGEEQFTFEGVPLLVTFTKYLLEYLEDIRKSRNLPIVK